VRAKAGVRQRVSFMVTVSSLALPRHPLDPASRSVTQ
jgi:hypothetical protein